MYDKHIETFDAPLSAILVDIEAHRDEVANDLDQLAKDSDGYDALQDVFELFDDACDGVERTLQALRDIKAS